MFRKILIANRGEIACRVMRTARRMGIRTVAVYSDADKDALHVTMADEAVRIGPPAAGESYLAIDKIVQACRETGAEAVHPGYGFLSENAAFAKALDEAGVVFIGPGTEAITAMGDKIASKRIARKAGVNTVPGGDDVVPSPEEAVTIARSIGYPVMIKASAGGGGKGMRIARDDQECRDGFERAASEARSSFGDGRVFVEKLIVEPRHVEIQVLADAHGAAIYLGERDCSLQRRHQKVIEESPSPLLDDHTRHEMGAQAVALARAVDYRSAGTVEFVVDPDRHFYFLEMNTRLQVEHPVTEMVTGLDLVELMIRVAAGERLPITQHDVRRNGWAIEARVYAEDPFRGFLPSTGRLVRYQPPPEDHQLRIDAGVAEGGQVSMFYDPMIAKVIAHGATRDEAATRLRNALNEFIIRGVSHNLSFLTALVQHPKFLNGRVTTSFIGEEYPDGFHPGDVVHDNPDLLATVAAVIHRRYRERAAEIGGQLVGYERSVEDNWVVVFDEHTHPVTVTTANGGHLVMLNGAESLVESDWQFGQPLFRGTIDGQEVCVQVERRNLVYRLFHWGSCVDVMVLSARAAELLSRMPDKPPPDLTRQLLSPMPGMLAQLNVAEGDEVKVGQDVAIIEAMKMENVLRAERDGRVAKVFAQVGDTLAVDQAILEIE